MDLYQLIRGGGQKQVSIDPNSVNSVLIDDDPQENFDRYVSNMITKCSNSKKFMML
jgi:hypothetical protein